MNSFEFGFGHIELIKQINIDDYNCKTGNNKHFLKQKHNFTYGGTIMKRFLSALTASIMLLTSMPYTAVYADDVEYLNKSDDFESYSIGDNWKTSAPSGWKIVTNGDTATAQTIIAQDPENADNKVLMIKGVDKQNANGNNYDRVIFMTKNGAVHTPTADKKLVMSMKYYIDGSSVSGLPTSSSDGRDRGVLCGIANNSVGGTYTVSNVRRKSKDDEAVVMYSRMGKYPSSYFGAGDTALLTDKWFEADVVLEFDENGNAYYKRYIDGTPVTVSLSGGGTTDKIYAASYDGTAGSSVITNAYGLINSVVTEEWANDGTAPTVYIDDVKMFEVDASDTGFTVQNNTSDDILNDFDIDENTINIEFSSAVNTNTLNGNVYVTDGENKYNAANIVCDNGINAEISLANITQIKPGNTYTLVIDKNIVNSDYVSMGDDFTLQFTTMEKYNPDPTPVDPSGYKVVNTLIDNNIEQYNIGDNWLLNKPDEFHIRQSGNLSDAEVSVAEDPVNPDNKCVKITPGHTGAKNGESMLLMAKTDWSKQKNPNAQKLIVKSKMYIEPQAVNNLPSGDESGRDNSSINGVSVNGGGTETFTVSTFRRVSEQGSNKVQTYSRTGNSQAEWYADKFSDLPVGQWFETVHVVDVSDNGEGAAFPTHWYKKYIDGEPVVLTYNRQDGKPQTTDFNRNTYAGVPFKSGYIENFYGIVNQVAVAPNAAEAPVIYVDDMYAAVIEKYDAVVVSGVENIDVNNTIDIEFPTEFNDTNAQLVKKAISLEKVTLDENGEAAQTLPVYGNITVDTDNNKTFIIKVDAGLEYNTYYNVVINPENAISKPYSIVDKFYQAVSGQKILINTKKAQTAYIDEKSGVLNLNGAADIGEADKINYKMKLINPSYTKNAVIAAIAVYGENEKLLKIQYKPVTISAMGVAYPEFEIDGLDKKAKKAALLLFGQTGDGTLSGALQLPDILQ